MNSTRSQDDPFAQMNFKTVMRVGRFEVYFNKTGIPYYQVVVSATALDRFGQKFPLELQLHADANRSDRVNEYAEKYCLGTVHWVSSGVFSMSDGAVILFDPETCQVDTDEWPDIIALFEKTSTF